VFHEHSRLPLRSARGHGGFGRQDVLELLGQHVGLDMPALVKDLGLPKAVGPAAFFFSASSPDKWYGKRANVT